MTVFSILWRLALLYLGAVVAGFAIFALLTRSPLFASVDILFYRGLLLAGVAALILAILAVPMARRWPQIDLSTGIGAVALSLAFNITFLIVIPVTIDRSVTVFLLSRIEASPAPMDELALRQRFIREYLGDMRQVQRRIDEQSKSGNISVDAQGKVHITPQGAAFMARMRQVAAWWRTDPRFVAPDGATASADRH